MASSSNKIATWSMYFLMALLILGLGGFGAVNFSAGTRPVATVGDQEISMDQYARALQNELNGLQQQFGTPISLQQAQAFGVDARVLSQLVNAAILDHEAAKIGLSVGDEKMRDELLKIEAFRGIDGKFDKETYKFVLDRSGFKTAEFEEQIRKDATRTILQAGLLGATRTNDVHGQSVLSYMREARDFTLARVDGSHLSAPVAAPTAEDLTAYYNENIDTYSVPESKIITYVILTPDMILDTVDVPEADIEALYKERENEFNQPERRMLDRLSFATKEDAEAAKSAIEAGEKTFDALVAERKLSALDVSMGDVSEADLDGDGAAVFGAAIGSVVGPFETDLGPSLYRVAEKIDAQSLTLEDASPELVDELGRDRARRTIEQIGASIDDKLAGGATLEEVAAEDNMQIAKLVFNAQSEDEVLGYQDLRAAAEAVTVEDYPAIATTDDGGIFALRLNEIRAKAAKPQEEVSEQLVTDWTRAKTQEAINTRAEEIAATATTVEALEAAGLAVTLHEAQTRDGFIENTPPAIFETVFTQDIGTAKAVPGVDAAYIVLLEGITEVDLAADENKQIVERINQSAAQSIAGDLLDIVVQDIRTNTSVTIDQAAINAVHTSFQ